jgi:hypothetical protein
MAKVEHTECYTTIPPKRKYDKNVTRLVSFYRAGKLNQKRKLGCGIHRVCGQSGGAEVRFESGTRIDPRHFVCNDRDPFAHNSLRLGEGHADTLVAVRPVLRLIEAEEKVLSRDDEHTARL